MEEFVEGNWQKRHALLILTLSRTYSGWKKTKKKFGFYQRKTLMTVALLAKWLSDFERKINWAYVM